MDIQTVKEFYNAFTGENGKKVTKLLDEGAKGLFCMLRIIRDGNGKLLPVDIAKIMGVSTARVAVAMKTLVKKGYIQKTPDNSDGRKVAVSITPLGRAVLEEREKAVFDLIEKLMQNLSEEETQTLLALAKKMFA